MDLRRIKKLVFGSHSRPSPVLLLPCDTLATVRVSVVVPIGSSLDTISGTAHLLEHILYHENLRNSIAGGTVANANAATSFHWTSFSAECRKDALNGVLAKISNLFSKLEIDPVEFKRERNVVIQELHQAADRGLGFKDNLVIADPLLVGTGYDCPPMGTAESLRAISEIMLSEFHVRHYHIGKAIVLISGPINPRAVRRAISRTFADRNSVTLDPANPLSFAKRAVAFNDDPAQSELVHYTTHNDDFERHEMVADSLNDQRLLLFRYIFALGGSRPQLLALTSLLSALLCGRASKGLAARLMSEGIPPQLFSITCDFSPQALLIIGVNVRMTDDFGEGRISGIVKRYFGDLPLLCFDDASFYSIKKTGIMQMQSTDYSSHIGIQLLGQNVALHGFAAALSHMTALNNLHLDTFSQFLATLKSPRRHGVIVLKPLEGRA